VCIILINQTQLNTSQHSTFLQKEEGFDMILFGGKVGAAQTKNHMLARRAALRLPRAKSG